MVSHRRCCERAAHKIWRPIKKYDGRYSVQKVSGLAVQNDVTPPVLATGGIQHIATHQKRWGRYLVQRVGD